MVARPKRLSERSTAPYPYRAHIRPTPSWTTVYLQAERHSTRQKLCGSGSEWIASKRSVWKRHAYVQMRCSNHTPRKYWRSWKPIWTGRNYDRDDETAAVTDAMLRRSRELRQYRVSNTRTAELKERPRQPKLRDPASNVHAQGWQAGNNRPDAVNAQKPKLAPSYAQMPPAKPLPPGRWTFARQHKNQKPAQNSKISSVMRRHRSEGGDITGRSRKRQADHLHRCRKRGWYVPPADTHQHRTRAKTRPKNAPPIWTKSTLAPLPLDKAIKEVRGNG